MCADPGPLDSPTHPVQFRLSALSMSRKPSRDDTPNPRGPGRRLARSFLASCLASGLVANISLRFAPVVSHFLSSGVNAFGVAPLPPCVRRLPILEVVALSLGI